MTTQALEVATQAQTMTTYENQEVRPHVHQNANTMTSRLRDVTRMNPPMFFGAKVNEDPHNFLMRYTRSSILWE